MIYFKKMSATKFNSVAGYVVATAVADAVLAISNPASAGPKLFFYFNSHITFNSTTERTAATSIPHGPALLDRQRMPAHRRCRAGRRHGGDAGDPDGRSWRDGDDNGGLRPLVKAVTTTSGWHILRIPHFAGSSVHADRAVRRPLPKNTAWRARPLPPQPSERFSRLVK